MARCALHLCADSGLCARVVCGLWLRPELKAAWPVPVALLARFLAKRIRFINMFHSVRLPSAEEERRRGYVQTERHRRLGRARASGDGKLTRDPQKRSGARRRGAQVLRLLRMRDGRHGKRRPHPRPAHPSAPAGARRRRRLPRRSAAAGVSSPLRRCGGGEGGGVEGAERVRLGVEDVLVERDGVR